MVTVSETAQHEIAEYFKDKTVSPVRVFLHRGCGGEQIAMALDARGENDAVFTVAGIDYIVDRLFLEQAQSIDIDFTAGQGFRITSPLKLAAGGCGGCGSSESCCS